MRDGYYRITYPISGVKDRIAHFEHNNSYLGTVRTLLQQGCTLEEVIVMTPQELLNSLEAEQRNTILAVKAGLL